MALPQSRTPPGKPQPGSPSAEEAPTLAGGHLGPGFCQSHLGTFQKYSSLDAPGLSGWRLGAWGWGTTAFNALLWVLMCGQGGVSLVQATFLSRLRLEVP